MADFLIMLDDILINGTINDTIDSMWKDQVRLEENVRSKFFILSVGERWRALSNKKSSERVRGPKINIGIQ